MRSLLAGLSLALGLATHAAGAEPDLGRMTGGEVAALARAMPKGGELHNHIGGAVFAETLLAWAVEDGACVDIRAMAIIGPCTPTVDLRKASEVAGDDGLRSSLVDSLSVRKPGFRDRSGHDQFFSAFSRNGMTAARAGDAMALVMDGLARQNTWYLEAMVTPMGLRARLLGGSAPWTGDPAATRMALASGVAALVPLAIKETDLMEARAREVLKCGAADARPGCGVTVRYLAQASRTGTVSQAFAQLQLGVALIAADPRWVGLQLVAPEDNPAALANYAAHMQAVDYLTEHGRRAPAALHAGELTLAYATPDHLSHHVADAVRIAGARRIGHGVDIADETGAEALAGEMAGAGVLVEVNLSSNAAILGVSGREHPYAWLRARGVPTSLSTDDAGILRIDLSGEYARAAAEGATYGDLKRSARNALAFSFLAGAGLWRDPGIYRRPENACAGQIGRDAPRAGACADLVNSSDKARAQWRHEALIRSFEGGWPQRQLLSN